MTVADADALPHRRWTKYDLVPPLTDVREGERSEDGRFESTSHAPRRDATRCNLYAVTPSSDSSRVNNAIIYTVCGEIRYFAEHFRSEIVEARHLRLCGMSKGAGNRGG